MSLTFVGSDVVAPAGPGVSVAYSPEAGETLFAVHATNQSIPTATIQGSGWTLDRQEVRGTGIRLSVWRKVAAGNETSVAVTTSGNARQALHVYADTDPGNSYALAFTPLAVNDGNVTSLASGTTGAIPAGDYAALAAAAVANGDTSGAFAFTSNTYPANGGPSQLAGQADHRLGTAWRLGTSNGSTTEQTTAGFGATVTCALVLAVYTVDAPENLPPTADAGPNATGIVGQPFTRTGVGTDPDGTIAAYEWALDAAPDGSALTTGDLVDADTDTVEITPDVAGAYTLGLVVEDDDGATSAKDTFVLTAVEAGGSVGLPVTAVVDTELLPGVATAVLEVEVRRAGGDPLDPGDLAVLDRFGIIRGASPVTGTPDWRAGTGTLAPAPETPALFVAGGANPNVAVDLESIIDAETGWEAFQLGGGWFAATEITRAGVTVRAATLHTARFTGTITIGAEDVTVDGVAVDCDDDFSAFEVFEAGATIRRCNITNFGKTTFTQAIWVYEEALDVDKPTLIDGNIIDDWGGEQFVCAISVGLADDDLGNDTPAKEAVVISNNTITNGPTDPDSFSGAIQLIHPAIVRHNYVQQVNGTSFQVKSQGSLIEHNVAVDIQQDGALYNRGSDGDDNVWQYNLVIDSDVGVDHFMGDNCVYSNNIFHGVEHAVRIKDTEHGTDGWTFERNTVIDVTGWSAIIWDTGDAGSIANVVFDANVWVNVAGNLIDDQDDAYNQVSGSGNVFHNVDTLQQPPNGTVDDPQIANPANGNYAVLNPTYAGSAGAEWPFDVGPQT